MKPEERFAAVSFAVNRATATATPSNEYSKPLKEFKLVKKY
jgi:hypothetical protein